jgi:hypothetical protein
MDTKTLAVGQEVYLNAGVYGLDGKVVKITRSHVYVQTYSGFGGRIPSRLLQFDNEGKECGGDPLFEGGPWYIGGTFTEREQVAQKHETFIEWWKCATYEQRLILVTKYYTTRLAPPLRASFAPAEAVAKIADISLDQLLMVELAKEAMQSQSRRK